MVDIVESSFKPRIFYKCYYNFRYNEVLKNGLPNWRSAVYYYRHVRKMGLAEGSIILFIIITFGQYAVGWAAYAEKRYTAVSNDIL